MEDDGAKLRSEVAVGKRQKARGASRRPRLVSLRARCPFPACALGLLLLFALALETGAEAALRGAQGRGLADGGADEREFGAAFESLDAADAPGPARCTLPCALRCRLHAPS